MVHAQEYFIPSGSELHAAEFSEELGEHRLGIDGAIEAASRVLIALETLSSNDEGRSRSQIGAWSSDV